MIATSLIEEDAQMVHNDDQLNFSIGETESEQRQTRDNVGMKETTEGNVMQSLAFILDFQKRTR